jgi:hypothetical protein
MRTSPETRLVFRFDGGDADRGELNFYDAGRFQYGAARFVYTLEYFRQTGAVLSKITKRVNAEYRIPSPERGSWQTEVLQIAVPSLIECAVKVPIQAAIAYVMERLIPGRRSREMISEALGEEKYRRDDRVAYEKERTAQERERTEQIRLLADTNSKALDLVGRMLDKPGLVDPKVQLLREIRDELNASSEREEIIKRYKTEFDKVEDGTATRLVDRARAQVIEMRRPLIRSADRLQINDGPGRSPFASLSRRSVEDLSGNSVDPLPSTLRGNIIRFDKENGWGKFRNAEFTTPASFLVPSALRNRLRDEVIDAMKEEEVDVVFYYVRDKGGKVSYLIFENVLGDL